jgi:hypothetical protein
VETIAQNPQSWRQTHGDAMAELDASGGGNARGRGNR